MSKKDFRKTAPSNYAFDQSKDSQQFRPDSDLRYKTELCRNWETGTCEYRDKCFYAHGLSELREKSGAKTFKDQKCENFFKYGYCISGSKCQFSHIEDSACIHAKKPQISLSQEKTSSPTRPLFIDLESRITYR